MTDCLDIWKNIKPTSIKDDYDQSAIDFMRDSFKENPFYEQVARNFDNSTLLDVQITNGDKKDKTVGYKRFISYPYDTIKFEIGDYLTWTYGGLSTDWFVDSLDVHKIYDVTGKIFKCNNILKWVDEDGVIKSYPCIIKDDITATGLNEQRVIVTFSGNIEVTVQLNDDTQKIDLNDKFLFAHLTNTTNNQVFAYKTTNIKSFSEGKKLIIYMHADQINPIADNVTDRIADAFSTNYTISIEEGNFEQTVGYSTQLTSTVKLNNQVVTESVTWSTSDASIGTIDALGNINLVSTGSVTFTASMTDNPNVTDSINVVVTAVPSGIIEVRITPNITQIFQGDVQSYNVVKYIDDVMQADTFNIVASGVPNENFTLNVIDGNNFTVTNNEFYTPNDLTITCTSLVDSSVGVINVELKGYW